LNTSIDYQQLFNNLLGALPLPVFIVDETLSICHSNQSALRLTGNVLLPPGSPLDRAITDSAIIDLVRTCINTGNPQAGHYDQTGSDISWKVSVAPLLQMQQSSTEKSDLAEPVTHRCYAVMIEDLAEPRRLERVQREFLVNISHELRTPLASVRLLAETLEDTIDTDPDKAQQFVEKIETEVHYLTGLVSELLDLSRIESGQLPMTIEPVEAEQLVREVMARMLPLAQRHRVQMRTDIQQGRALVAADGKLIMRVLVNLIHNAIKFTPSGGIITIGTATQADQHIQRFFVRDTGVGIRVEDLPRVFERFYKTDRARSKADFIGPGGGGTGLGLAIARQVIEAHGGRIIAESAPGSGSIFIFTLPIAVRSILLGSEPSA